MIKYNDDLFSFSTPVGQDEQPYMATFDFDRKTAEQLRPILGEDKMAGIMQPATDRSYQFHFDENFLLSVKAHLPATQELIENDREIFLPLIVTEFII
jgi:hypothetical protein